MLVSDQIDRVNVFKCQNYHKGVELGGLCTEFRSAFADTQLNWTWCASSTSGRHLTHNPVTTKDRCR